MAERNDEQFIDADAPYGKETNFEQEVIRQMRRCNDTLSKEVTGGTMKVRLTKSGQQETYIEDVHELVINCVDTFRILLQHFIKKKQGHQDKIDKIKTDIKDYKDVLGERKMIVPGVGLIKIKEIGVIHRESAVWRELLSYKTDKYRELYEVLIAVYTDNKAEIAQFSEE